MAKTAHKPVWLKFVKKKINFFELLAQQAETTVAGLKALRDWIEAGDFELCKPVHKFEHEGDDEKHNIEAKLRDSLVTPFDREDIYDISAQLDLIINCAKRLVKDVECFHEGSSDKRLVEMANAVAEGGDHLLNALRKMEENLKDAVSEAHKAQKTQSRVADLYRESMRDLLHERHLKERVIRKLLFDRMDEIASRIERLGEKISHICIQLG